MKVVIDNNVIVDALKPNPQFEAEAQEILRLASIKAIDGFVNANSLTDIFYILRKEHGAGKAKAMIKKLLLIVDIISIESEDCVLALERLLNDFEDALVDVCAKKIGAACVVSRDDAFIKSATEVEIIKPGEFIELCKKRY
jgi:predicted nucleic acid-binding protein